LQLRQHLQANRSKKQTAAAEEEEDDEDEFEDAN
jgi:hypothetical protein